jgi:hypothetical protein
MNIKKGYLLFIITGLLSTKLNAQKNDYLRIRDSLTILSCKQYDSITVQQTLLTLKKIDISNIDSNINRYYRDLGWAYYRLYLFTHHI